MRISIKVKPQSKKPGVEKGVGDEWVVRVQAPPVDGKANKEVIERLAEYFKVKRSQVKILKGEKGKSKLVEIG